MIEKNFQREPNRYLMYFVAAFIACYIIQGFLFDRLISIGNAYIGGGAFIYFTSPLIIDVVAEVYGYQIAKRLIWCGLFSLLFLAGCIYFVFKMPYPIFWSSTIEAYHRALDSTVRTCLVSTVTIFIGQKINSYLIVTWKIMTRGKYFWLRSLGSSVIGDGVTVTLFSCGVFFGRVADNFFNLFTHTIFQELIIMVLFTAIGAVPASILVRLVSKAEGIDRFAVRSVLNPFENKSLS
jgi:uncharacterized integral membrane protein (TIGR00697 family)